MKRKNPSTLHIGTRKRSFDSHAEAYRAGLSEQNKGVHSVFVIVDGDGKRAEYSRAGKKRNPGLKEVSFTTDKRGRPIAYKFTRGAIYPRNIRIGYDAAKLLVSTGQAKEIPYRPMRRQWMATNPKKRNPEAAAIKMREKFTGLPADSTVVVSRTEHVHEHLAALGDLIELRGKTIKGQPFVIEFKRSKNPRRKSKDIVSKARGWVGRRAKAISGVVKGFSNAWINGKKRNPNGPTILASNEAGTQLFLENGDQSISLATVGLKELEKKESCIVGTVRYITYHSKKRFDGKDEEHDYEHEFSEESGGPLPSLRYDIKNRHLFLEGGVYHVPKPFFGTSPGITD